MSFFVTISILRYIIAISVFDTAISKSNDVSLRFLIHNSNYEIYSTQQAANHCILDVGKQTYLVENMI